MLEWLRCCLRALGAALDGAICGVALVVAMSISGDAGAEPGDTFELQIGTLELPPFGWVDPERGSRGITYDLNQEIGRRSGLPYRNQVAPAARLLESMVHGRTHFVLALENAGKMAGAEKLALAYQINFIVVTKRGSGIKTLEQLNGRRVIFPRMIRGVQGGMQTYLPELAGLQIKPVDVNQYEQTLRMLQRRKSIHAAVISEPAYHFELDQLGLTPGDFGRVLPLRERAGLWAFVQPDLPQHVKERLTGAVQSVREENLFRQIAERYLPPSADGATPLPD